MDGLTPGRASGWRNNRARKSAAAPARTRGEGRLEAAALGRTVQQDVIPRLLHAHRPARRGSAPIDGVEVAQFAQRACGSGPNAALDAVARRRDDGASIESILLDLLVPAARHLAARWMDDGCRYEELAIGILHLQQVLHGLSADFVREGRGAPSGRRALLLSAPAEQGMLGLYMISEFQRCVAAEFFQRAGWDVWRAPPASRSQLESLLRTQWFDVIDVTVTCAERLCLLATDLAEMRRISRNPRVGLVVGVFAPGGAPAERRVDGADAAASDPRDMLSQAEALVAQRERMRTRPIR